MPTLNLPAPGVTPGPQWASDLNMAISTLNGAVDLLIASAGQSGGIAVAEWTGTAWPSRPNSPVVLWSSLAYDSSVPAPSGMTNRDFWLADKDTVVPG